jgi:hypothetical protein
MILEAKKIPQADKLQSVYDKQVKKEHEILTKVINREK